MHKLCRQVSIESPGSALKDCVFSFVVPVPDTPEYGARVKVNTGRIEIYSIIIFMYGPHAKSLHAPHACSLKRRISHLLRILFQTQRGS